MAKETTGIKTDLKTVALMVTIGSTLIIGLSMIFMIRSDAIASKAKADANEVRITDIETKYARFEGVMDERTRTIQGDVQDMKKSMQKLLENLQLVGDE